MGDVEDAKGTDDLITPASFTGISKPDFENLDFKIASGLRKILTGHFKKQVTTAEGKGQSEKRSVTGRQTVWMIYDFYKISGDNGAIMDFSYLSTFQLKNDSVQAFETKWDEGFSAVNERPTDNMLEILCKMQVENVGRVVASLRDGIRRQEI